MSTTNRIFNVPDISCDHCKSAIETSVGGVAGVLSVNVDVAAKTVAVAGGTDDAVVAAIAPVLVYLIPNKVTS